MPPKLLQTAEKVMVMTTDHEKSRRGLLIAFEGIDGTGKTTQIRLLAEALKEKGYGVIATCEPTNGPYGKKIRQLFLKRHTVSREEELALFVADRRQHVNEVIEPALDSGKIVLTDRYYLSTAAYQGAAGGDPEEIIRQNEDFAPVPDLVILLVAPVVLGVHRVQKLRNESLNDFEQEQGLEKVAAVFARLDRGYIKRLDATQSVEEVHRGVMMYVDQLFSARGM